MRKAMEFAVEKVCGAARTGVLRGMGETSEIMVPTPNCTLYTRIGCVPHLTRDMLLRLENLPRVVQYSLTHMAEHHEALSAYGKGIKKFTAMEDFLSYVAIQDTSAAVASGYNDKTGSAIWARGGKIKIDLELFLRVQEALQADAYQALCDSDTDKESSRKRVRKAVDRSLDFLEKHFEQQRKSEKIQNACVFGTLEGGHILDERLRSAKETSTHPVTGFCFEGLHNFGPATEQLNYEDIRNTIEKPLESVPSDKPRLLPGIWDPLNILQAVSSGIDVFESVYPYIVTERGSAMIFKFDEETQDAKENNASESTDMNEDAESKNGSHLEINLKDKSYAEDFGPLVEDCKCFTCQKHSRAYINHLLNTSELLAGTLLMMHNLHHYFGFFCAIRNAIENQKLDALTELTQRQTSPR